MREIKFREWDKRDNFMYLVREMYWLNKGIEVDDGATVRDAVVGDNTELMQYTGLKDKNGIEIYEGDICEHQNPQEQNYVEYRLGVWCLMPHGLYLHDEDMMVEVIGNIWESPELLEVK